MARLQACPRDPEIPDRPRPATGHAAPVNLITDPQEREPVSHPHLHSCVAKHFNRIISEFHASVQREPLTPTGAPLDHVPSSHTTERRRPPPTVGAKPPKFGARSAASGCTRNSREAVALVRRGSPADAASGAAGGRSLCANSTVGLQRVVSDSGAIPRPLHPQAEELPTVALSAVPLAETRERRTVSSNAPALPRAGSTICRLGGAITTLLPLAHAKARALRAPSGSCVSRPQQEPASRSSALMLPIWMRKRCRRVDLDGGRCRILADRQSGYGRGANWPPVQKRHRRGVLLARHRSPAPSERAVWNNSLSRCSDRPGTRPLPRLNHPAALPGARATLMPPADLVLESRPRRATMLT